MTVATMDPSGEWERYCDEHKLEVAEKYISELRAEIDHLKPLAEVGAAVLGMPSNSSLLRGGVDGQEQWMTTQGGAYLGWHNTLKAALTEAGWIVEEREKSTTPCLSEDTKNLLSGHWRDFD